jgi:hypothetical protein
MTVEWMDLFMGFISWPVVLGSGVLAIGCAIVGMLAGKALMKRHFVKAGML